MDRRRISRAVPIASSTLATTCAARAPGFVAGARFEQFRVRQDNPELVVQLMKEIAQVTVHTWRPLELPSAARAGRAGSRQSVSAKMRIDPPAVRTYSTFPAEIQL